MAALFHAASAARFEWAVSRQGAGDNRHVRTSCCRAIKGSGEVLVICQLLRHDRARNNSEPNDMRFRALSIALRSPLEPGEGLMQTKHPKPLSMRGKATCSR